MKKWILMFLCIGTLSLSLGCGKTYVCQLCGEENKGKPYYGMYGQEVFCADCARKYWMPLDYRAYRWEKMPE